MAGFEDYLKQPAKADQGMKVFLRNAQNGWYYQAPSRWTPEQQAARDLQQMSRAISLAFEAHLEDVEILLCYEDSRYDLVLPLVKPPPPASGEE